MVPILMQWRGEAPGASEGAGRYLRNPTENTAAQMFFERRKLTSSSVEAVPMSQPRSLEVNELKHIVTFQDCVFRVRKEIFLEPVTVTRFSRNLIFEMQSPGKLSDQRYGFPWDHREYL